VDLLEARVEPRRAEGFGEQAGAGQRAGVEREVGGQQRAQALGHFGGGFGEAEVGLAVADPRRDLRPGVADQVKLHAARIPK
jgi:hypothetical protein